ncbi:hypothetical protein LINGRAHAP2_LOCUS23472, partial [Linum grandiflorum]
MDYLYGEVPECVEVVPADERLLLGDRNRYRAGDVFTNEDSTIVLNCRKVNHNRIV